MPTPCALLDAAAIFEEDRDAVSSPPVAQIGRGVGERPFTDMPDWRMFVALNDASVCVGRGYLQGGGDEARLRDRLNGLLRRWEAGTGFLSLMAEGTDAPSTNSADEAAYELGGGLKPSEPLDAIGRGVAECPWTDVPGWRMFLALSEASVVVCKGYLQAGGDEEALRRKLSMGLLERESAIPGAMMPMNGA